jgi:hypothetical protein
MNYELLNILPDIMGLVQHFACLFVPLPVFDGRQGNEL